MSLVRNEQAKLAATYFNNLAVALAVVGGITPLVSAATGGGATPFILLVGVICFAGSGALHLIARRVLKGLTP